MTPEDIESVADAVAERLAEGFLKLPSDVVTWLKPYAGYRSRFSIDGSISSLQAEIIVQDDGGFTFGLLDCTGRPVIVERRYHP
jgi:hypothetical protein